MNDEYKINIILPMTYGEWEKVNVSPFSEHSSFGENIEYGEN